MTIADRRTALGLTQVHVADVVGLHRVTYGRIEAGASTSRETMARIRKYLAIMETAQRVALRALAGEEVAAA